MTEIVSDDAFTPVDLGDDNVNGHRSSARQEAVTGSDAETDSIGSGPAGTDSNGSARESVTHAVQDYSRSDVCTTFSVTTNQSVTNDASCNVDNAMNVSAVQSTSIFVDPYARGEITRPSGWPIQSSANIQSADILTSVELSATRHVTLTSALPSLIDSLRKSAVTAVKRTRQSLAERVGHGSKTVDADLEVRIDALRTSQQRYINILQLARTFVTHFNGVIASQQALGAAFSEMSQKMPELHDEFAYNAETQRVVYKNGETLLHALNFFMSTVSTLCFKTIEDTVLTIQQYEDARVEYDAYRVDVELHQPTPDVQQRYEQHKQKFENLRQVVDVKLKLLDENKLKVMHQQLILFHNAIAAYFSGNQSALADTLQHFSIKLKSPNSNTPSWLESLP